MIGMRAMKARSQPCPTLTRGLRARATSMNCNHCQAELENGKTRCALCGKRTFIPTEDESPLFGSLSEVEDVNEDRIFTETWWGPLFGGGWVQAQRILLGGEAGGGKSTFALQAGEQAWIETGLRTLYLATEEKAIHIKARCQRLEIDTDAFAIVTRPLDDLLDCLDESDEEFGMLVLDSLSDLIGQDLNEGIEAIGRISDYLDGCDTRALIIDHVNKGEEMAGLYRLRHAVDTTVYLRSKDDSPERIMEIHKNRHGQGHLKAKLLMRDSDQKQPGLLEPDLVVGGKRKRGLAVVRFTPEPVTPPKKPKKKKKPNSHEKVEEAIQTSKPSKPKRTRKKPVIPT